MMLITTPFVTELLRILFNLFKQNKKQLLQHYPSDSENPVKIGGITFDNLSSITSLDPEDFVTLRLYTNQDAGNVLWERAFEAIILMTDNSEFSITDDLYISADNPKNWLHCRFLDFRP